MKSREFLESNASMTPSKLHEKVEWRRKNRRWLRKSQMIALAIMTEMETKKMTQRELAKRLDVTPQYVNKILRGQENLSIETIDRIEMALGIELMSIPYAKSRQKFSIVKNWNPLPANIQKSQVKVVSMNVFGVHNSHTKMITA